MNDDYEITEVKGTDPFTMLPNTTKDDEKLSNKALGLLTRMIGRPPGWILRRQFFITAKDGKATIKTQMEMLRDIGYVKYESQKQNGRFLPLKIQVRRCLSIPWDEMSNGSVGQNVPRSVTGNRRRSVTGNRRRSVTGNRHINNKQNKKHCAVAGTGISLGVKEVSFEANLTDRFYKLAINKRWLTPRNKFSIKKWRMAIGALVVSNNHETDLILKVFNWYVIHHRDQYVPKVRAITTFCDRFEDLVDARRRWLKDNPEDAGHWGTEIIQILKGDRMAPKTIRLWIPDEQ